MKMIFFIVITLVAVLMVTYSDLMRVRCGELSESTAVNEGEQRTRVLITTKLWGILIPVLIVETFSFDIHFYFLLYKGNKGIISIKSTSSIKADPSNYCRNFN